MTDDSVMAECVKNLKYLNNKLLNIPTMTPMLVEYTASNKKVAMISNGFDEVNT